MNEYEIKYRMAYQDRITKIIVEAESLEESKQILLEMIGWCEFISIKPLTY